MYRVAGYPRSGNFYLLHSLKLMFAENVIGPFHNTAVLRLNESENKTFVIFRNPVDCIAAWHEYDDRGPHALGLEADVAYYLRYTKAVLDTAENHTVIDFEKAKSDLSYIAFKVGQQPIVMPTIEDVRESMRLEGTVESNLPNPVRYANRETTKAAVEAHAQFDEVMALYAQLQVLETAN